MSLAAEFDSPADRRAYALVAAGAAVLSYWHARTFFEPFMGPVGASVTPLMMDAIVYWLAAANVRQALAGRPLPMLRAGAYALLALTVTANALGGATLAERVFLALPAALFGFLVEARTRLALYSHRAEHGDDRLRARLWLRHPVKTVRAWLWLARQSAPAFDRATAERDQLRAARDAVALVLPGRARAARRARAGVLRELRAGRLSPAAAVTASGLLTRAGLPELYRVALVASLGGAVDADTRAELPGARTAPAAAGPTPDAGPRTEPVSEPAAAAPEPGAVPDAEARTEPVPEPAALPEPGAVPDARPRTELVPEPAAAAPGPRAVPAAAGPGEARPGPGPVPGILWRPAPLPELPELDASGPGQARPGGPGLAPAGPSAGERRAATNRAALVGELAGDIAAAAGRGESWLPDYAALEDRTGFRRSWAEKVVRDARAEAARRTAPDTRTDPARTGAGVAS